MTHRTLVGDDAGLVCSVDARASDAGAAMLRAGGSAADAAIATNAVLAVTCPHLCGMGGDLWALVHEPRCEPVLLNASGRAGSGVDATALRDRNHTLMPRRGDPAVVPVPGCVDGWLALHERFGQLPLREVLAPAIDAAEEGFTASALLAMAAFLVDHLGGDIRADLEAGQSVRRPGVGRALRAVADDGRAGFYGGEFGRGLIELGGGVFTPSDLDRVQADWQDALGADVFGARVWTAPPGSQGYLALAILKVAEALGLPMQEEDPRRLRILVAAAVVTGADRPELLHEDADPADLLSDERLRRWIDAASSWPPLGTVTAPEDGDTTYLCVRDGRGMAVSLIQSQAADFGAYLMEPATGIYLHNRGVGFSLEAGHPAELAPGRRPPSTLMPMLITDDGNNLIAVTGTMGGDSQPHLMAQHCARILHSDIAADAILDEPRWVLKREGDPGFDLWAAGVGGSGPTRVPIDELAIVTDADREAWGATVQEMGLTMQQDRRTSPAFGHAHLIVRTGEGWLGLAEPRVAEGGVASDPEDRTAPAGVA